MPPQLILPRKNNSSHYGTNDFYAIPVRLTAQHVFARGFCSVFDLDRTNGGFVVRFETLFALGSPVIVR